MPSGPYDVPQQSFGGLGALLARAMYRAAATRSRQFGAKWSDDKAKRAAASYFKRLVLASTRRVSAPCAGSAPGYGALRQARTF